MKMFAVIASLLLANSAMAARDIECSHKKGELTCTFKKDTLVVGAVINGGECPVPRIHHPVAAGEKYTIPGSRECYYNRMLWLYTGDGSIHKFYAM